MDLHVIPARRDEPEHWHYDVRYVVIARGSERFTVNEESLDLAWRRSPIWRPMTRLTSRLRRMARKWLSTRLMTLRETTLTPLWVSLSIGRGRGEIVPHGSQVRASSDR